MNVLYPWILLLVFPWLYCLRHCSRQGEAILFSNISMLKEVASGSPERDWINILRSGIVVFLLLALARPVIVRVVQTKAHEGYAISLILDASNSMHEENRFELAKKVLSRFVASRPNDRFSLSLFADFSAVSIPMTEDHHAIQTALKHVKIGAAGGRNTALYEALYRGVELAKNSPQKHPIVILLTDGLNTVTSIPLQAALAKAKKYRLKVYTIGLGHDYQKPVLQMIAQQTGGKFFALDAPEHLQKVYDTINRLEPSLLQSQDTVHQKEFFLYPLVGVLILMLLLIWLTRPRGLRLGLDLLVVGFVVFAVLAPMRGDGLRSHVAGFAPVILALDLSRAMDAEDVYPSRLVAAKAQALTLLAHLTDQRIGLIAFDRQAYLISPPTEDHAVLRELIQHIDPSVIQREDANLTAAIAAAVMLLSNTADKYVLLLTSGGSRDDLSEAIAQADQDHVTVSVYGIGTERGATIPEGKGLVRQPDGTPALSQLNPALADLADATEGKYLPWGTPKALDTLRAALRHRASIVTQHADYHPSFFTVTAMALALLLFVLTSLQIGRRR